MSCFNPEVTVHDCKLRVDGISKYLDSSSFRFDYAFGEEVSTDVVSDASAGGALIQKVWGLRGLRKLFEGGSPG